TFGWWRLGNRTRQRKSRSLLLSAGESYLWRVFKKFALNSIARTQSRRLISFRSFSGQISKSESAQEQRQKLEVFMLHRNMSSLFVRSIASPFAAACLLCAAPGLMAATLCVNPGGTGGCKSSINAAVAAASAGDTIRVASGTYKEDVVISKSLSLVAWDHRRPVIDATGLSNGIFVNGMAAAPAAGVSNVLISGFDVENANFEGILVANASDVTLLRNHVHDNDRALNISA